MSEEKAPEVWQLPAAKMPEEHIKESIRRTFEVLHGAHPPYPAEFRLLPKGGGGPMSGLFKDAAKFADAALKVGSLGSSYITLNPVNYRSSMNLDHIASAAGGGAVADKDIVSLRWFFLD